MKLTQERLDKAFKRVCRWYFKDWQPSKAWKATVVDKMFDGSTVQASVNSKAHTIEIIRMGFRYVEDIETLLIHEIAHVTSRTSYHSKPWQNEMSRVIRLGSGVLVC